jgi:hypothetical protein
MLLLNLILLIEVTFSTPTLDYNISNDVGRVKGHGLLFCRSQIHVSRQRRRTGPLERVTTLLLR